MRWGVREANLDLADTAACRPISLYLAMLA